MLVTELGGQDTCWSQFRAEGGLCPHFMDIGQKRQIEPKPVPGPRIGRGPGRGGDNVAGLCH